MHLVVPNLTEQNCVVLDSTAVSCSGRDGTGQSCYGLHYSALHLTGLDSTAVDLYGPGLCWRLIEMYLAGRKWIGIGLDGTGPDGRRFHWMDWTARQWSGLDWTGLSRTTSEDWTGRHCTSSDWTVVVWAWLRQTALHCTTLDWTGKYYTGPSLQLARLIYTELHSTFPKETDKDCTALYMNVLHWTRPNRIA